MLPARYKNFAIGSGNGRALQYNVRYTANYQTNAGTFDTANGGNARLEGQATDRKGGFFGGVYCTVRGGSDKRCFFAADTHVLGTYPLNTTIHRFRYP